MLKGKTPTQEANTNPTTWKKQMALPQPRGGAIGGSRKREKEIQDALENLFLTLDYDFEREQVSFSYSTKSYKPDFTSDSLKIAIDVKLCKNPQDEKRIIDEINADIPAYKSHYENLIFVVYDLGFIRKVDSFTKGIEKAHEKVLVRVIKH